jgi:hypothetical protein
MVAAIAAWHNGSSVRRGGAEGNDVSSLVGINRRAEQGIHLRRDGWQKLVDDDEHWEVLAPVTLLAHEHDPDPEMRSEVPITPEKREEVLCHMAVCTLLIYDFFRGRTPRESEAEENGKEEAPECAVTLHADRSLRLHSLRTPRIIVLHKIDPAVPQ